MGMSITTFFLWVGYAAGTLTTLAFFPQLVHIWQTKRADDLNWSMLIIFTVGIALWLVYGIGTRQKPVIVANLVTLGLQAMILILKLRYSRRAGREVPPPSAQD
jgi:MtN3 and saliva related transmembrane protein